MEDRYNEITPPSRRRMIYTSINETTVKRPRVINSKRITSRTLGGCGKMDWKT